MNPTLAAALAAALALGGAAAAAPYTPENDAVVLERLPARPGEPAARELRALRAAAASDPANPAHAAALARRYFELAMAEGDPRYAGYGVAALGAWSALPDAPPVVLTVRAMLRQYRHDFAGALDDLARAAEADPDDAEAHAWRAAILMVGADYAAARRECEVLARIAGDLLATGCLAHVDATTGRTRQAYERLLAALQRRPEASPGLRLWVLTRLAEMSRRLGDARAAERHFRDALALGVTDNFLFAAYADFLLEQKRPAEVAALLKDWARSDTLLLRLALAEKALNTHTAAQRVRALGERFAAAALRGEQLHLQEEARYLLHLRGDARGALKPAAENWKTQREPRDAAILLEAALAAREPDAARPALAWLEETGYEDPALRRLAASLGALRK